MNKIFYLR